MAHSCVNQLIHAMWATDNESFSIPSTLKNPLYAYVSSLIKAKNGRVFTCKGSFDHIHTLFQLPADISLVDMMGHIKACSSKWIKNFADVDPQFAWQSGYCAISIDEDKVRNVCAYIESDEANHQTRAKKYSQELLEMLQKQNIPFKERFLLDNSHAKILIHMIWSTYERAPILDKMVRADLFHQMEKNISDLKGVVHAINGVEDHVHLLVEVPKNIPLADLLREIKTKSTHWLKHAGGLQHGFEWQNGYGAFSVSFSSIDNVKNYIHNQEEHHRVTTFKGEWEIFFLNSGRIKCNDMIPSHSLR